MAWNKPIPFVDSDIAPFYEGLKRHEFLLFQCRRCQAYYWPAAYCHNHPIAEYGPFMGDMEWVPTSGRGVITSFNIHNTAFHPGFREDVPYAFALVQLDEGPMFGSTVIDCDLADVHIGMRVEVAYEDQLEDLDLVLPRLRPAA